MYRKLLTSIVIIVSQNCLFSGDDWMFLTRVILWRSKSFFESLVLENTLMIYEFFTFIVMIILFINLFYTNLDAFNSGVKC
jgi:hypothetical protein